MPSCQQCITFMHDPKNGWKLQTKGGKPVERPASSQPPCRLCPKIETGDPPSPRYAHEPSEQSLATIALYREIQAGAPMPDDAIVRRNCAVIHRLETVRAQTRMEGRLNTVIALLRGPK